MVLLKKSDTVEEAMAGFGDCLKRWEQAGKEAKASDELAERMTMIAAALKKACDLDSKGG